MRVAAYRDVLAAVLLLACAHVAAAEEPVSEHHGSEVDQSGLHEHNEFISAGPIWNGGEAPAKCKAACEAHKRTATGNWYTPLETWGRDSVCQCVHWSYSTPDDWKHEFPTCGSGRQQSPVDITIASPSAGSDLGFSYAAEGSSIVNNGHTIQVNFPEGSSSSLTIGGKTYKLAQFHFHSPSENHIAGVEYAMEVHLVHKHVDPDSKKESFAVVGVMLEKADAGNPAIAALWGENGANLPSGDGELPISHVESPMFDPSGLLPATRDYFTFAGSLTTPPCSEGLTWIVLKNPITVSESQVKSFHDLMGRDTDRPVQRTVSN